MHENQTHTMTLTLMISLLVVATIGRNDANQDSDVVPPNILFILVDDLGYANVGYHLPDNKEINTPNIDYLATKVGLRLNRHYVHYTCSPTRSSLQSGRIPYHVNLQPGSSYKTPSFN